MRLLYLNKEVADKKAEQQDQAINQLKSTFLNIAHQLPNNPTSQPQQNNMMGQTVTVSACPTQPLLSPTISGNIFSSQSFPVNLQHRREELIAANSQQTNIRDSENPSHPSMAALRRLPSLAGQTEDFLRNLVNDIPSLSAPPSFRQPSQYSPTSHLPGQPRQSQPPPYGHPMSAPHQQPHSSHNQQFYQQSLNSGQFAHTPGHFTHNHGQYAYNPSVGTSLHLGAPAAPVAPQRGPNTPLQVEDIVTATIINPQLRPYEFVKKSKFSYANQVKASNTNLACHVYGYLKYLIAVQNGTCKQITDAELLSRLYHLCNVMEITCTSSSKDDFQSSGWDLGREYDARIYNDIETGLKSWESLGRAPAPDAMVLAQKAVEQLATRKPTKANHQTKDTTNKNENRNEKKICSTYNTWFSTEGCWWESQQENSGKTCSFSHFCSDCKSTKGVELKHKSIRCHQLPTSGVAQPTSS